MLRPQLSLRRSNSASKQALKEAQRANLQQTKARISLRSACRVSNYALLSDGHLNNPKAIRKSAELPNVCVLVSKCAASVM
jgi:hypothetical protein